MDTPQFNVQAALEQHHWWFLGKRRILTELVREVLPPSTRTRIVDIGCGTGGNIAAFADAYTCVGTDPHPEAIQLARRRFPHVQFICGAVPQVLSQIPQPVALYLLTDVLEHVEDDRSLFSGIVTTILPGAFVLITVPADMRLWTQHDVSHGHYRRYDVRRFQRLWADLPLSVLLMSYYNARLYPIVRCVRTMNRWLGRTNGAAGTDFQTPPRPVNRLLQAVFASESQVLRQLLAGRRATGFSCGVSLIALLRREPDAIRSPVNEMHDIPVSDGRATA